MLERRGRHHGPELRRIGGRDERRGLEWLGRRNERGRLEWLRGRGGRLGIERWTAGGCRADIDRKLGYRIALTSGSAPEEVKPGGSFTLELGLSNEGWATMMTPRPVIAVLESAAGERVEAALPVDPRDWLPGAHELSVRLRVPANLAAGTYRLALWLPDDAEGLRSRPEYSVQIANQGVWNATRGDNTLTEITLSDSAPGTADPGATIFGVIP